MDATVCWKNLTWPPILHIGILSIGTLISFVVAYSKGDVSAYLPFISETGAVVPEMCIFSLCLILGSFVGAIVICYRHLIMTYFLKAADAKLQKLNHFGFAIGLISMAGLAGVAAFPMSTVLWAHLLAAGIHFTLAMLYVFLQTFISYRTPGIPIHLCRLRLALSIVLLNFLFLLVIFFPLSQFRWNKINSHVPALKVPEDQVFGIMFCSSLFEWILYTSFLVYMLTFSIEFRNFHLLISVVPSEPKPVPVS
ncbi:DNA damage-regulated autophagy modulator protein 1-like isoform X2 [Stegodyphus dumicola]|uniref:DNA damage-regulated autophagy modulator protein 1-like isoform X2 n=1 Tax=Stegodyphus dumicola TaxID=202533 RepID=UPI0015A97309|nr:DNA damage-regulated autophagy modulator protein 1-like isoform X2 [Stegodyphus dumicola]